MNKTSGGDGIPAELLQILKDNAVTVLHSICQQIWKTQQWPQDWERSVFILIPKKGNAKEWSKYHTTALISHASKVMLKISQARLQQCVNWKLPDVQAEFRKGRGTRDQTANTHWIIKKQKNSRKTTTSASLMMLKAFDCVDHNKLWKILEELGILDQFICLLRNLYLSQEETELDMEQRTNSKLGMEYVKAVYCHPTHLTSMQSTSCEMLGWMNHKLEARLLREISITSDVQKTPP